MPAGHHQRIDPPRVQRGNYFWRPGQRLQGSAGPGQLLGAHLDGALMEIGAQGKFWFVLQIAMRIEVRRQLRLPPGQQRVRRDQRPGVQKRIAGAAMFAFQQNDRVKRCVRGFLSDPFPGLIADPAQCGDGGKNLGDAPDRERLAALPGRHAITLSGADRDGKLRQVDLDQLAEILLGLAPIGVNRPQSASIGLNRPQS